MMEDVGIVPAEQIERRAARQEREAGGGDQVAPREVPQDPLRVPWANFHVSWQAHGEIDDAVVEKRAAQLEPERHRRR